MIWLPTTCSPFRATCTLAKFHIIHGNLHIKKYSNKEEYIPKSAKGNILTKNISIPVTPNAPIFIPNGILHFPRAIINATGFAQSRRWRHRKPNVPYVGSIMFSSANLPIESFTILKELKLIGFLLYFIISTLILRFFYWIYFIFPCIFQIFMNRPTSFLSRHPCVEAEKHGICGNVWHLLWHLYLP